MGDNLAEIFALHGRGTARNGTVTAAYSEFNDRDFIYHVTRDLGKFSDMVAKLYMYASSGGSAGALQYLASNRNIPYSLAVNFLFCDDRFTRILSRSQQVFDFYDLQEERLETICRNCPEVETVLNFCAMEMPNSVQPGAAHWGCVRSIRNGFDYTPTDMAFELGLWNTFTAEEERLIESVIYSGQEEPCEVSHPLLSTQQLMEPLESLTDFSHMEVLEGCATAMAVDEQFDGLPAWRSVNLDHDIVDVVENALNAAVGNHGNDGNDGNHGNDGNQNGADLAMNFRVRQ